MVHFLSQGQVDLARHFGELTGDETEKFVGIRWRKGPDGHTPRLTDCKTYLWGRVERRLPLDGDHAAFVLEPVSTRIAPDFEPMRYHQVRDFHPGHPA
jgi:flavin reductase (DIM6/NTAB) family NADH-FMN oxidoreductase RutF